MVPSGSGEALIYILSLVLFWILFIGFFNYFRPRASEKRWLIKHGKRINGCIL